MSAVSEMPAIESESPMLSGTALDERICQFLVANNLQLYLQKRDWAAFARLYNGPEYLRNQYDKKLEIAYRGCQNAHS